MRLHDISGLVVCAGFYILPFAIIIGFFALSRLWKSVKWNKKKKLSEQLEKNCEDCVHCCLGTDYLHHCNIASNLGPDICSPKMKWCYRKDNGLEEL